MLRVGTYDDETAAQEQEESDAGQADFWKPKVGRNFIRILPPPEGESTPFRKAFQHFVENGEAKKSLICTRLAAPERRQPCAVCVRVTQLQASRIKADQDKGKKMAAKKRVFVNIIDREKPEMGTLIFAFGTSIDKQLISLRNDPVTGGNYTDPENGYDLVIDRVGAGLDTKYSVRMAKKPSRVAETDEEIQSLVDNQHDLNRLVAPPKPEDLQTLLGTGDEELEVASPPPRQALPAARPAAPRIGVPGRVTAPPNAVARRPAPAPTRSAQQDMSEIEEEP